MLVSQFVRSTTVRDSDIDISTGEKDNSTHFLAAYSGFNKIDDISSNSYLYSCVLFPLAFYLACFVSSLLSMRPVSASALHTMKIPIWRMRIHARHLFLKTTKDLDIYK